MRAGEWAGLIVLGAMAVVVLVLVAAAAFIGGWLGQALAVLS